MQDDDDNQSWLHVGQGKFETWKIPRGISVLLQIWKLGGCAIFTAKPSHYLFDKQKYCMWKLLQEPYSQWIIDDDKQNHPDNDDDVINDDDDKMRMMP